MIKTNLSDSSNSRKSVNIPRLSNKTFLSFEKLLQCIMKCISSSTVPLWQNLQKRLSEGIFGTIYLPNSLPQITLEQNRQLTFLIVASHFEKVRMILFPSKMSDYINDATLSQLFDSIQQTTPEIQLCEGISVYRHVNCTNFKIVPSKKMVLSKSRS